MNIKIVDSWLREFLETKASAYEIAKALSLSSVSVDRLDKNDQDYVYEIEITTNRPDLMSVKGIAKETAAALEENNIKARFLESPPPKLTQADISFPIEIKNDPSLVNRIMAVVREVEIKPSPKKISSRLELSGIRSLSNLVDVTNYVMREIGHPAHVFDYDLLQTKKIIIRESRRGEVVKTLDGKQYRLFGGDIVADDGTGQIIDLLGVMGTANSVVNEKTKRILFFLENNNATKIRQTSMSLGIRTEAAIINEKGIDPDLMQSAFKRGVELYQEIASGKVVSKFLDLYPNKSKSHTIKVSNQKINKVIGVKINPEKSLQILKSIGFKVKKLADSIEVNVPTIRSNEVLIEEDVIEEIARIYGYHKLPSILPAFSDSKPYQFANKFYFEERIKNALKYWGLTEVYTYSLISEELYSGPIEDAMELKNPLTREMAYLRNSLVPSLLMVASENKKIENLRLFELSNTYHKNGNSLPTEKLMLSAVFKSRSVSFFEVKGLIETLFEDLGIKNTKFRQRTESPGASVVIGNKIVGYVEILNSNLIDFELNFDDILDLSNIKKVYKPLVKFPSIVEDITFVLGENVNTEDVASEIKLQSFLITDVSLIDQFENARTFRIKYQAEDKTLTNKEISEIKKQIIRSIGEKFKASVK